MPRLWFVRHGSLPPNPGRLFLGQRDVPLDAAGEAQARFWRDELAPVPFALALASDLARCAASARIILGQRPVKLVLERDLREICLGSWEGRSRGEVERAEPGAYARRGQDFANHCPPGGESFAMLAARVQGALERWAAPLPDDAQVLVVTHLGVIRLVACACLVLPVQAMFELHLPHACCLCASLEDVRSLTASR